ncbi:hypothetical protein I3842_11G031900, partial [Carya illinoinensis]
MNSWISAVSLSLVFLLCTNFSLVHSSTIGVGYISRLLELQDRERAPPLLQVAAARAVLRRLLPSHFSSFDFQIVSKKCGGESCFMIKNNPSFIRLGDPEILIAGFTGVEILAGLHWYLKHQCGSHISWDKTGGAQLFSVPRAGLLPRVNDTGILVQRPIPWSYYQNAATSSYSFAWWDWKRWEKEIDWMALQGINLPLAFTGQEAIWQKVFHFERFKLMSSRIVKTDLDDFFGGPAFLAWSRMGNLHVWGGPLPQSWLDQQLILQKKILFRMYELGMTPVLPAFSGNVPVALKYIFPSAKITRLGNWPIKSDLKWCCTYLLDATDSLFIEIGRAFINQQLKEYGRTSHIYNCDTFDENTPPVDDPDYISSLGGTIFRGMQSGDNDAIWLMQGWLFSYDPFWRPSQMKHIISLTHPWVAQVVKVNLCARAQIHRHFYTVPVGKLVVLDLFAEVKPLWITSEQFYAVPYIWKNVYNSIKKNEFYASYLKLVQQVDLLGKTLKTTLNRFSWCMLHNFAGNVEMYGILDAIAPGPVDASKSEKSTMANVGVGMSMEGIEQNPVVYELMSEMAFQHNKVDVKSWIHVHSTRRYGRS